jgi:3-phenylpropionate/trans-cinnamate dioxygenase ferredoxin reductase subunit
MTDQAIQAVTIIGAGQAGGQAASSLRAFGFSGAITLIGEETLPPYQRPPLSKKYLMGEVGLDHVIVKPAASYDAEGVTLRLAVKAVGIDRAARMVRLADGQSIGYDALILATGARVRRLHIPGADLAGVHYLRSIADADAIGAALTPGARLAVVGGGYIGLEVAASARKRGAEVVVLEAAERILSRVTSPLMSTFYAGEHARHGVEIRTNAKVEAFEGRDGRVAGVRLAGGDTLACDLAIIGVGVAPNQELAAIAGLECRDGVIVDRLCRTSDPAIFAIGDCARRPLVHYGGDARLESVHNALEQAKIAASVLAGRPPPAEETPWFWSDQFDLKLQIAGLFQGYDQVVLRGDPDVRKFAAFYMHADRLLAVDAVNAPGDFLAAKQLIARDARVAPALLADTSVSMKEILTRLRP